MKNKDDEGKRLRIAYFDCFSGISGDMCLGALVDAGLPLKEIRKNLKKLNVGGYSLTEKKVERSGMSATKVDVILKPKVGSQKPEARKWKDVREIITKSSFPDRIKQKGSEIFRNLFSAEAKIHGKNLYKIHLHEIGGTDCLIDIFGTLVGLELLGVEKIYSSSVNLGKGVVRTAHGILPVPAPATAEILKNCPVYSGDIPFELTTPTGAIIIKSLAKGFGGMPVFVPEKIGFGAGSMNFKDRPNVLRIFIGSIIGKTMPENSVTVIETNIDDMNPQIYEYLFSKLFRKGALDVYMTQVIMKKMRPGVKLSVLCEKNKRDDLIKIILNQTTTLGVRYYETLRVTADREFKSLATKYGKVRLKIVRTGNFGERTVPEYEDCKKIAEKNNVPLIEIIEEARKAGKRN